MKCGVLVAGGVQQGTVPGEMQILSHESTPKAARKTDRENIPSEHGRWKIRIC